MLVLAIDTSARSESLAIARWQNVIASISLADVRHHSLALFERIEMLLQLTNLKLDEVDGFAAVSGPGSFTGLRIGLAAIKGIAESLNRPLIGITAFDALAVSIGAKGLIITLIDAGRNEVYSGFRSVSANGMIDSVEHDIIGSIEEILGCYVPRAKGEQLFFVGTGAVRYKEVIIAAAKRIGVKCETSKRIDPEGAHWTLIEGETFLASYVAIEAALRLSRGIEPELHPYYLKPSDAELKCEREAIQLPK